MFATLADPTRWRVLNLIAGLVEGRRTGREVRYTVRPEQLGATARWMAGLASQWDARLAAIKRIAEEA